MNKENLQDGLILFIVLGGFGFIFSLIGLLLFISDKRKQKNCVAGTYGYVADYRFRDGIPEPIVQYEVSGNTYRKIKHFSRVIATTRRLSLSDLNPNNNSGYIDEEGVVHINKGAITNLRTLGEQLCPIGTRFEVLYNPKNPKQAFVEEVQGGFSIFGVIYMILGVLIIGIGAVIFMLS